MKNNTQKKTKVSVIGLGSMGSALARFYLKNGDQVTVWNRTASKAKAFTSEGAKVAETVEDVIAASELVLICVFDYAASDALLRQKSVLSQLAGKTVVQFTTGTPKEAAGSALWLKEAGAKYLEGAIQVAPEQMAKADTTILFSGDSEVFAQNKQVLDVLGGNNTFLGNDITLANTMDLATLCYVYGTAFGFLQGAALAGAAGLNVEQFGTIVKGMAANMGAFLEHEGRMIATNNYEITQSPLSISVTAVDRIEQATKEAKLDTRIPALFNKLLKEADDKGWGNKEAAILVELLRGDKLQA